MKTIFTLCMATLLGLIVCNAATAQNQLLRNLSNRSLDASQLGGIRLTPQLRSQGIRPAPAPTQQPSFPSNFSNNIVPGLLGKVMIPSGPVQLPPGPLRELNPQPQPQPQPLPQPQRNPNPLTLNLGPNGPSISFGTGGGQNFNIPLPGQRFAQPGTYHSPTQVLGYGPNGQVYTGNGQVAGSYHTPGRNLSQMNGTQRYVEQPIYDSYGNLVGHQAGTVWNNSITGQQHGNMTTYTPNGTGGHHQSTTQYSTAGGNITPIKN